MISKEPSDINGIVQQAISYLKKGQSDNAIIFCQQQMKTFTKHPEINIILSQAHQQKGAFDAMLTAAQSAVDINANHFTAQLRLIECLIYCSKVAQATEHIDVLAKKYTADSIKLSRVAELYLHCGQHLKVAQSHQAALNLQPQNPAFMYNLAAAKINLGELSVSNSLLNQVIKLSPNDFDAYTTRSGLFKATKQVNNTEQLQQVLDNNSENPKATVALGFALAKEHEDMGHYSTSWDYLATATQARRKQMNYQVDNDVQAIENIMQNITCKKLNENQSNFSKDSPVFIMGLPRSGTTLVDRILSSHNDVASLGEINSLAFSLIHAVGNHKGKQQLIEKSTAIDFAFMAEKYTSATRGYGNKEKYLIDKTPLNYLYLGLIKRAFPNAKIIHVKRNAMDSCYAMFKTLFRMGYPFSYDLQDLGRYTIAYDKLMGHWQNEFPNSFFNLRYEELVSDSETTAKALLEYCDVPWNPSVLQMHLNQAPTATASAVQVREKIHSSSVAKWKKYEKQLSVLSTQLKEAGINIDAS